MEKLHIGQQEKPYFIAYRLQDSETAWVSAVFGSLTGSTHYRTRMLSVDVRVGDYKLDNTNDYGQGSSGAAGYMRLAIEDDYQELRRQIWLGTDGAYKKAVEDLSKKRALLQNKNLTDLVADFYKEDPTTHSDLPPRLAMNVKPWEGLARDLSGLFRQMPDAATSGVTLSAANTRTYYLTSEGTSYVRLKPELSFTARASTQAADGMPLSDSIFISGRSAADLPAKEELAARIRQMGAHLKDLRQAGLIETYNGPVLFEGEAAAEAFSAVFVPDLLGSHRVISDNPNIERSSSGESPFTDKIGARVLPDSLGVVDDPGETRLGNAALAGACRFDDEGMRASRTVLVEKGILKTLLTTRNPVRGIDHSTGSRHGGAAPSNLFVTAENGLGAAELREKFLALVKQRNKEYGILVRHMRDGGITPILAYKVFPDGREELIRNASITGLTAATFKEIVAASKESYLHTAPFRGRMMPGQFSPLDTGGQVISLVVPSLLFEDLTLRKMRGEVPRPPVAPHPYFEK
jgi:predicted Zn-dependent protease